MRRLHETEDAQWLRTSIIATSVINPNIKNKADRLKPDHFVPKRGSQQPDKPKATSDWRATLERVKAVQAVFDAQKKKPK